MPSPVKQYSLYDIMLTSVRNFFNASSLRMTKYLIVLLAASSSIFSVSLTGQSDSHPIVDVRFDGPYLQLENSSGDEWAPTWSADDALYTGNDDGGSFGGIPENAIAFGKV